MENDFIAMLLLAMKRNDREKNLFHFLRFVAVSWWDLNLMFKNHRKRQNRFKLEWTSLVSVDFGRKECLISFKINDFANKRMESESRLILH